MQDVANETLEATLQVHFQEKHIDFGARLLFFLVLPGLALIAFSAGGVDFRGYYAAAELVLDGGNPYDYGQLAPVLEQITGFAGNNPYFYPPWFCLFFIPLTVFPFQVARLIWLLLNAGLFYAGLKLLRRALIWKVEGWRKWGIFLVATLMFGAYCLRSEQAGILLFFALALTLRAVQRQQHVLAGLALVLFLSKPQATALAALALALWTLKHQRRTLMWSAGWTALLTLLATLFIPRWWSFDLGGFGRGLAVELAGPDAVAAERVLSTVYDFQSFIFGIEPPLQYALALILGLAGFGLLIFVWRRLQDPVAIIAAALVLTLLITPYALQYDYVPLVLVLFWIFMHLNEFRNSVRRWVLVLLALSFFVPLWQEWSYQGYLQLLFIAAAFAISAFELIRQNASHREIFQSEAVHAN